VAYPRNQVGGRCRVRGHRITSLDDLDAYYRGNRLIFACRQCRTEARARWERDRARRPRADELAARQRRLDRQRQRVAQPTPKRTRSATMRPGSVVELRPSGAPAARAAAS